MPVASPDDDARPYGRRAFVGIVAAGLTSLWWGEPALDAVSGLARPLTGRLPTELRAAVPSPTGGWRIYTVNPPMPAFDPGSWRLRIDGLVRTPLALTLDDLRALPRVEQVSDFHCVTGWSVAGVRWAGVRFADLLAPAGPLSSARALRFASSERPYADTLSLEQAALPDAMLALDMDASPLRREHGAPARVVMPRMYGYKNVKWVERITVTDRERPGYWERRGYDRDAWVGRSNGRA